MARHEDYPLVSVVISTYDRPQLLDRALTSVAAQTFDDFEVVLVDDCSPPSGVEFPPAYREVLDKHGEALDKRGVNLWAYRLGENSGYQCMPKNRAIDMANGDYIAYLDDDNTWRPDHLAVLTNAIRYMPAHATEGPGEYSKPDFSTDMVYSRICYHFDDEVRKKLLDETGKNPVDGDAAGTEWNPSLLTHRNYIDTSVMLHSKGAFWRLVRDSGFGWDQNMRRFADWNFVWRWATHGLTAKMVDKVTMDYYLHANSIQITRPPVETPICLNYAQYQALRKDRNQELRSAL